MQTDEIVAEYEADIVIMGTGQAGTATVRATRETLRQINHALKVSMNLTQNEPNQITRRPQCAATSKDIKSLVCRYPSNNQNIKKVRTIPKNQTIFGEMVGLRGA